MGTLKESLLQTCTVGMLKDSISQFCVCNCLHGDSSLEAQSDCKSHRMGSGGISRLLSTRRAQKPLW